MKLQRQRFENLSLILKFLHVILDRHMTMLIRIDAGATMTAITAERECGMGIKAVGEEDLLLAGNRDLCLGLTMTQIDLVQLAGGSLRCGPPLAWLPE